MANLNFNAAQVAPRGAFDTIPNGWYPAIMVESTLTPTKNGDGSYLACQFKIQGGEHNGRVMFDNLNINNPNPKAVEIAYQTLSSICHATGVIQVQDSAQLHNHPLMIKIGLQKGDGQYEDRNVIKGYKAMENRPLHASAQVMAQITAPLQQPPASWPTSQPAFTSTGNSPTPPWQQMQQGQTPPAPQGGAIPPWAKQ